VIRQYIGLQIAASVTVIYYKNYQKYRQRWLRADKKRVTAARRIRRGIFGTF